MGIAAGIGSRVDGNIWGSTGAPSLDREDKLADSPLAPDRELTILPASSQGLVMDVR